MSNMQAFLNRLQYTKDQIIGSLTVYDGISKIISVDTLELPWIDNQRRISCIPAGTYRVVKRKSEKYGDHFHVLDVPNRDFILIHFGNYNKDTLGCILPGLGLADINGDGLLDVTNSKKAMDQLNKILPNEFIIKIV